MSATGGWHIGDVTITPVFEVDAAEVIAVGIPDATPENLLAISWLRPNFVTEDGRPRAVVQSFVVETPGARVLVDTCVGNGKVRNEIVEWSGLQTDFLSRLPSIDIVVCTHFHFDHIGWNTMLVDGQWVPTFPDARYVFLRDEFDYWSSQPDAEAEDDHAGFSDSVQPIIEAGLAEFASVEDTPAETISFIATRGHTPGHVSVLVESNGEAAVITGDAIHHPCQIAQPEWFTLFDTHEQQARESRRALLERLVDTSTLLIGSHFSSPTAGFVRRDGAGFSLAESPG